MENKLNHSNYSKDEIERYLDGQMSSAEMHAFELAMMDDAMLSDAVDGYKMAMNQTNTREDLSEITSRLKTTSPKVVKGTFKQWMRIAATLIILLSASVVLYRIFYVNEQAATVQQIETTKIDSSAAISTTTIDTSTIAKNDAPLPVISEPRAVIIPPVEAAKEKTAKQEYKKAEENEHKVVKEEDVAKTEIKPITPSAKDNASANQETVSKIKTQDQEYLRLNRFAGRIVDANNSPLPFANITEKNSGVGTYADVNGYFVLLSQDSVLTVQTKSLGYISSITQIKTNNNPKIVLSDEPVLANAPSAGALYERNKSRNTFAASDTTAEELEVSPYDGWNNYKLYVDNNMRTPFENELKKRKQSSSGEVELSFDVNPDGSLSNIKVERSNCNNCNTEAIRLLKEGPRWKSKTGKKEHTKFTVRF
jgi:outer membrane biosynthesis protein TonB